MVSKRLLPRSGMEPMVFVETRRASRMVLMVTKRLDHLVTMVLLETGTERRQGPDPRMVLMVSTRLNPMVTMVLLKSTRRSLSWR